MLLPQLTPLQFVVVHLLFEGPRAPGEVREALRGLGLGQNPGAFSRLIRRLECGPFVEAVYDGPRPCGALRDCRLAVTDLGVALWKATREFYASLSLPPRELKPVATDGGDLADYPARERKGILHRRAVKETREVLERFVRSRIKARGRRRGE